MDDPLRLQEPADLDRPGRREAAVGVHQLGRTRAGRAVGRPVALPCRSHSAVSSPAHGATCRWKIRAVMSALYVDVWPQPTWPSVVVSRTKQTYLVMESFLQLFQRDPPSDQLIQRQLATR